MQITICCPSYRRPKVETLKYIPFCRVYVDEAEYEDYKRENPNADIVKCPIGVQGNVSRVKNYILKTELEKNDNDVCLLVDDDLKYIGYWEKGQDHKLSTEEIIPFIEKYSVLAQDIGAYLWGMMVNTDPQSYRVYSPFSTLSFIGGPFSCFLKGNDCFYDEGLPLKEDYDMTIQQLNKHRVVLRVNKFHYNCKQSEQAGGCATYRNLEREKEQLQKLQKKWGTKIVKCDVSDRSHKGKRQRITTIDYNPVIKVPIKGM